ncbi:hypothetical protein ACFCP7_22950 [Paenibacillus elgii]
MESEDQAKKAEAHRDKLRRESKNPLLDELEREKLNKMVDLNSPAIKKRFEEMLDRRAPQYITSITFFNCFTLR